MRLYNTLSHQIEEVKTFPIGSASLGLYACGPTVYDYAHLGHMRKYFSDAVLISVLRASGFEVQHVMNVTDVGHLVSDADEGEDKMEKGARQTGKTVWEVAQYFTDDFLRQYDLMGLPRPANLCAATDHIPEQIAMVQSLESQGFTYTIPGDGIYFDTAKDPTYGQLANLKLDQLKAGARIGENTAKRNPSDFALWKFSPTHEQRQMEWESPWGKGFPGWHIECSAMSTKYLGDQFAIHTGGIDHVPVHHTNEIAQSENATGKKPFVKHWVHHNFLRIDGKKMSKSLNNFYTLDDIIAKGFSPGALKILFLQAHHRDELNFTWESLAGAQKAYDRWQRKVRAWGQINLPEKFDPSILSPAGQNVWQYLQDDLKTPQALAAWWGLVKSDQKADSLSLAKIMLLE